MQPLGDQRCDRHRPGNSIRVSTPDLQALEEAVDLVGRHLVCEHGEPDAPGRNLDAELIAKPDGALEEGRRLGVAPHTWMNGMVGPELPEPDHPSSGRRLLEQSEELVAQARRREIAHETHLDAPAGEPGRVILEPEAVAGLVPDRSE